MLARTLEAAGLATILVTMMPFWAERIGVPRSLALEFPFGHTLGQPHNIPQQRRVITQALKVLEGAESPGTVVHSPETWPVSQRESIAQWQPAETTPIIKVMAPKIRVLLRGQRKAQSRR